MRKAQNKVPQIQEVSNENNETNELEENGGIDNKEAEDKAPGNAGILNRIHAGHVI